MNTPTPSEVVDFYTQFSDDELQKNEYRFKVFYRNNILKVRMMRENVRIEIAYSIYAHFKGVFPISRFCMDLHLPVPVTIRYAAERLCESEGMEYTPSDPVVDRFTTDTELDALWLGAKPEKPSYELAALLSLGKDEVLRRWREMFLISQEACHKQDSSHSMA